MRRLVPNGLFVLTGLFAMAAGDRSLHAQGLIWKLPEDGAWVRFEGDYNEEEVGVGELQQNLQIPPWDRHLILKSVGSDMADYNGQTVPCRWIEIEALTGRTRDGKIDPGPAGERIYKVLVPESAVVGNVKDGDDILVSFLPIVRGWRKFGESEPQPIDSNVLQVYPLITLLPHYRELQEESGQPEDPQVTLAQPVSAVKYKGTLTMESPLSRSKNEGTVWRSDDVPFGVARWSVKIIREAKDSAEPRSAFKEVSHFSESMKAAEVGTDARSKLAVP